MKPSERIKQMTERAAIDKRKLWEEIERRDPSLAAVIKAASERFGKPKSVTVEFKS